MKIKIELASNETIEEAHENLLKALKDKKPTHSEKFEDRGVEDVFKLLLKAHDKMYKKILKEISEIL